MTVGINNLKQPEFDDFKANCKSAANPLQIRCKSHSYGWEKNRVGKVNNVVS